ncbi:MAG: microcystin-dependent protein [Candidatus Azotimanducaceae bacterium]|jgi:microcystin-dependent protein
MGDMIAEIKMFAGSFAPRGWAFCQGQLLSIRINTTLYAIIGTTYGGDGRTTFAVPDYRGRAPIGAGSGAGLSPIRLSPIRLGAQGGSETTTLSMAQLPSHSHTASVSTLSGTIKCQSGGLSGSINTPSGNYNGIAPGGSKIYSNTSGGSMAADALSITGGSVTVDSAGSGQPFSTQSPYIGMNFIICLDGIFPSRT